MHIVSRLINRPAAQAAQRLDLPEELERLAAAIVTDLNGAGHRRVEVILDRLRRGVDAAGGSASLGRAWAYPWRPEHHVLATALLAQRRLRLAFDADLGWLLIADRPVGRQGRRA